MAKIFPMEGSYSSEINYFWRIEKKRKTAVSLASQGQYYLAIKIFRDVVRELPRMHREWPSHQEVLYEICSVMHDSFHSRVQEIMSSHHVTFLSIIEDVANGGCVEAANIVFAEEMKEHFEDVSDIAQTSVRLTHMTSYTDFMCGPAGIQDGLLEQLERIFMGKEAG